jgi:glycosyltransferase involved in cell wall biosynthesis
MKLHVIVTEFPKSTETFIYRDLLAFQDFGAKIELHHLAPYRHNQPLHGFAAPLAACARYTPFLGREAIAALLIAGLRNPLRLARTIGQIVRAYHRRPKLLLKSLALTPKALAIARRARCSGADHVHAEFAGHPATVAWIGRRFGGPPYSVSCRAHDIFRTQALLDRKLGEAVAVRTVSEFGRDFLRDRVPALANRDIEVIHSSVDVDSIEPIEELPSIAPFRILYVGALEPKKGVEHLLDALGIAGADLGDWTCELIGDGPSRPQLESRATQLGLGARVTFLGRRDFAEVTAAYRRASVCVAPSVIGPNGRQEGIPNVMIEALAFQRPVISTAISGIPELIHHGSTGLLVPPGDPAALAKALLRVSANVQDAFRMARRGRQHVARNFSLAVNARKQLDLFEPAPKQA